jgi:predicted Rossmann fold flavoprotein
MKTFDAVIVGAGAAGLFCAGVAAQQGLHVLILDHSDKVAEKIRISGGGRSNFTNCDLDVRAPHKHFVGDNPQFCRSALSRYTPQDFIGLMQRHGIPFEEKHKGQLFCQRSAEDLIQMLLAECNGSANGGSVTRWQPCSFKGLRYSDSAPEAQRYEVDTSQGTVHTSAVVVATGGLSIPKIGATDLGYRLAQQFNLRMVTPRPGLVPLTFDETAWAPYAQLSGLSLPVRLETGSKKSLQAFDEDLLFTHRGLSGPGVLQISSYWQVGTNIRVNLCPEVDLQAELMQAKQHSKKRIANELNSWLPSRLADTWTSQNPAWQRPVIEASDKALQQLAERLSRWSLTPTGTEGYKKAEVTVGGVDTRDLSQQTMESKQPGLYFIGEVVDITGWLGGYNFQWAWSSAHACAQALAARLRTS